MGGGGMKLPDLGYCYKWTAPYTGMGFVILEGYGRLHKEISDANCFVTTWLSVIHISGPFGLYYLVHSILKRIRLIW